MTSRSSLFKNRNEKMTGGYIPRSMAEHLALLAVWQNTSRTSLIIDALQELFRIEPSERELILDIANMAMSDWKDYQAEGVSWKEFVSMIQANLTKRRLSQKHIGLIMAEVEKQGGNHEENETSS